MALYLNILTVVLLALVAGLLLMLYFQLRTWREVNRDAPLLAEKLTETIMSARKGLADLKAELIAQGPELGRLTSEASKLRVELQFLLQRAEQTAARMEKGSQGFRVSGSQEEEDEDLPVVRLAPEVQAIVEQVAVANGQAAKPLAAHVTTDNSDPLEELLANLQTPQEPNRKQTKRKRVGPVTQAELDLQQSLKGTM